MTDSRGFEMFKSYDRRKEIAKYTLLKKKSTSFLYVDSG